MKKILIYAIIGTLIVLFLLTMNKFSEDKFNSLLKNRIEFGNATISSSIVDTNPNEIVELGRRDIESLIILLKSAKKGDSKKTGIYDNTIHIYLFSKDEKSYYNNNEYKIDMYKNNNNETLIIHVNIFLFKPIYLNLNIKSDKFEEFLYTLIH